MVKRIALNKQVFNAYIQEANVPLSAIKEKVEKIDDIMSGEINPTFNQLIKIAKIINVPVGALLLNEKMTEPKERLDFRVLQSKMEESKSEELKATIQEMRMKQAFLKEEIEYELPYIHLFKAQTDVLQVAHEIRKILDVPKDYMGQAKPDAFNYFREKINRIGVFVFLNGKVKDNTHRPLNIKEFRGFVLSDKQAPIIFINQTDTKNGRLFTLIHELVHLFVGNEGIFNSDALEESAQSFEAHINKITAELLVPLSIFEKIKTNDIHILETIFPVSQYVLYRRLLDTNRISRTAYQVAVKELEEAYTKAQKNKKLSSESGGNFNNNLKYRMDSVFFRYVDNALKQNKISYTDAFQLVGVGYKGYKFLAK
ncbi:ImmA/IrrE family metallo-endopeptidase [Staphylococcus sp. EZ-P03]|uniref:ImmA/IrrE family metallo-endopeptidase n=1 Tax=Staphylococcus sp. EZ-P03 TaxID=2282739 RepID=UPI000DF827DE|nr:ImmA/IrrE family metallo-endopeptidase [Staphylococcus sp. EZ-P03]